MRLLFALLGCLSLTACMTDTKAEFSCPGSGQSGVSCMPAIDVFKLSEDPEKMAKVKKEQKEKYLIATGELDPDDVVHEVRDINVVPTMLQQRVTPLSQPKPILMPAEVMRIWIAPWKDEKQDLHMTSYVFTEITPRRWSIGEEQVIEGDVLSPYMIQN